MRNSGHSCFALQIIFIDVFLRYTALTEVQLLGRLVLELSTIVALQYGGGGYVRGEDVNERDRNSIVGIVHELPVVVRLRAMDGHA